MEVANRNGVEKRSPTYVPQRNPNDQAPKSEAARPPCLAGPAVASQWTRRAPLPALQRKRGGKRNV